MTTCPKWLQWAPVFTTTRPVSVTAEVAVKRAVRGLVHSPEALDRGSMRSRKPISISRAKARIMATKMFIPRGEANPTARLARSSTIQPGARHRLWRGKTRSSLFYPGPPIATRAEAIPSPSVGGAHNTSMASDCQISIPIWRVSDSKLRQRHPLTKLQCGRTM